MKKLMIALAVMLPMAVSAAPVIKLCDYSIARSVNGETVKFNSLPRSTVVIDSGNTFKASYNGTDLTAPLMKINNGHMESSINGINFYILSDGYVVHADDSAEFMVLDHCIVGQKS